VATPIIWGWATHRDKWQVMRSFAITPARFAPRLLINKQLSFFFVGAVSALSRKVDTWDSPIAFHMLNRKYECLIPPFNLVRNIGADEFAVHTKQNSFPIGISIQHDVISTDDVTWVDLNESKRAKDYLYAKVFNIKVHHIFSAIFTFFSSDYLQQNNLASSVQSR
jgi:hypothetical protein